jgi:hypothetical protein
MGILEKWPYATEPDIEQETLMSIAVSLKRLADAEETNSIAVSLKRLADAQPSLRDRFAMVLLGVIAPNPADDDKRKIVKACYAYADAMLEGRKEKPTC